MVSHSQLCVAYSWSSLDRRAGPTTALPTVLPAPGTVLGVGWILVNLGCREYSESCVGKETHSPKAKEHETPRADKVALPGAESSQAPGNL